MSSYSKEIHNDDDDFMILSDAFKNVNCMPFYHLNY